MKNNEVSELNRAIFTLLYDQHDCPDVTPDDHDDTFVDYIIYALIEKNELTCPFKNYSCEKYCKAHTNKCLDRDFGYNLEIDCGREQEDVWREFINIDANEG